MAVPMKYLLNERRVYSVAGDVTSSFFSAVAMKKLLTLKLSDANYSGVMCSLGFSKRINFFFFFWFILKGR